MVSKFPLLVGFGRFQEKTVVSVEVFLIKASNFAMFVITGRHRDQMRNTQCLRTFQSDPCLLPQRPSCMLIGGVSGCLVDSVGQDTGGQVMVQVHVLFSIFKLEGTTLCTVCVD